MGRRKPLPPSQAKGRSAVSFTHLETGMQQSTKSKGTNSQQIKAALAPVFYDNILQAKPATICAGVLSRGGRSKKISTSSMGQVSLFAT